MRFLGEAVAQCPSPRFQFQNGHLDSYLNRRSAFLGTWSSQLVNEVRNAQRKGGKLGPQSKRN